MMEQTLPIMSDFVRDLSMTLISLWPASIILKRLGLSRLYAMLLLFSILLPLLGQFLLGLVMVFKRWPNFPPLTKRPPRERMV